ncbi:hypothetical protein X777_03169 [Ooceraea biroi]|uniref:Uncharacterized protein n=1 Tax=Ooceraea biroi TaxID=2015173 RepID=A0A026WLR5_OOCBI|nr:hypothetical protein X777_03169 [Ooceraea biroi]
MNWALKNSGESQAPFADEALAQLTLGTIALRVFRAIWHFVTHLINRSQLADHTKIRK